MNSQIFYLVEFHEIDFVSSSWNPMNNAKFFDRKPRKPAPTVL